jgi:hypothetical protein
MACSAGLGRAPPKVKTPYKACIVVECSCIFSVLHTRLACISTGPMCHSCLCCPQVIEIEFDPADLEAFIKVADAIEEAFPTVIVNGNEERDGRPGSFEVRTEEGVSVFSRLAGAAVLVPGPEDIIRRITNMTKLPGAGTGELDENRPFCG